MTERLKLFVRYGALSTIMLCAACNLQDPLTTWTPPTDDSDARVPGDSGNDTTAADEGGDDAGNNGTSDVANIDMTADGADSAPDARPEPRCGDGNVDPPEICDGDCPTCDDGDPCTSDTQTGSAQTCDVVCSTAAVTACVDADSCCPAGCTSDTDADCPCIPTTCADAGKNCGEIDDGCGQTVSCGTCSDFESCFAGVCQASLGVGDACPGGMGCPQTGGCIVEEFTGWPGGYCSLSCPAGDADCPAGTHCEGDFQLCVQSCTQDDECNAGYGCFDYTGSASDPRQDGRTECLPVGNGTAPIGAACMSANDCMAGEGATCFRAWANGYCSFKCAVDADCPTGSHCSGTNFGTGGDCFRTCATDSDCRGAGYACGDFTGDGRNECGDLPDCPRGFTGPRCDQPDCVVPVIPPALQDPYCTAGFCKDDTGACLRLADNPNLARANTNSACIPAVCCDVPQVVGTCNDGFCNDGTQCISLATNPQFASDAATTACIQAECALDCDEPGGGCNPGFCYDGNSSCLWLTTYTELQRGPSAECLPLACP